MQARIEEIGQSLLRSAHDRNTSALGIMAKKRRKSSRTQDLYEEHFIMQEDRVLVLTNSAMVCLRAPGFAAIQASAEEGRLDSAGAPEIPVPEMRWAVLWKVLRYQQLIEQPAFEIQSTSESPKNRIMERSTTTMWRGNLASALLY